MANAAAKKLAQTNTTALKTLHLASLAINLMFLASYAILHRPRSIKPFVFFSLPAFFLQHQLERMGRPTYDAKGALIRSGDDLATPGLTEYFHDVIYVTWLCDLLVILTGSNACWYLYFSIPVYATYKVYTIFFAGRGGHGAAEQHGGEVKSKRQEKLEKRGGQKIKYSR